MTCCFDNIHGRAEKNIHSNLLLSLRVNQIIGFQVSKLYRNRSFCFKNQNFLMYWPRIWHSNMATLGNFHKIVNEPHQLILYHNILPLWADLVFSLTSQALACWVCCRDIMQCLNVSGIDHIYQRPIGIVFPTHLH